MRIGEDRSGGRVRSGKNGSSLLSRLTVPRLRRASQFAWPAVFLFLPCCLDFQGRLQQAAGDVRLQSPVRFFLNADPFAAILNPAWTETAYAGPIWSLAVLIPTFSLARFFRGWICPLGLLHDLLSRVKLRWKQWRRPREPTIGGQARTCPGAVALLKAEETAAQSETTISLPQPEKEHLLKIARAAVETAVRDQKLPPCTGGNFEALMQDHGAFVTLTKRGQLRGCIGYVGPNQPLYLTVRDAAVMAALRDTRFSPVGPEELGELEYEISVLSPLHRVQDVEQIQVGTHGLMISNGEREGLLLPQVPVEQHWDRATFLRQVCRKADLGPDAWREASSDLFSFTAIVVRERDRAVTELRGRQASASPPQPVPS